VATCLPPEGGLRETSPPPASPSRKRANAHPDKILEHCSPFCGDAVDQDAGEHKHRPQIQTAAEEAQRRRRHPLATPLGRATEALATVEVLWQTRGCASGLADIAGVVEGRPAVGTSFGPYLFGQIPVEGQKQEVKTGIS